MIQIICGPKGSGKTKKIIDAANQSVQHAKGHMLFITDTKRYMYDLAREIRFIDVTDFNVAGENVLCGFIQGAIAASYDTEYIFVDGAARISGVPIQEMPRFFYLLEKVADMRDLKMYITCSCEEKDLPDFAKKFLK